MSSSDMSEGRFSTESSLPAKEVPIEELVSQVYESAQPVVRSRMLAQLVGKVYETAPETLRGRLLEQLLRPLGVLSLVVVANGIFAKILFRSGWPNLRLQLEEVQKVRASDVIELVDHVQQVSVEALDGLAQLLGASPLMASSAAAAVLVALLVKRARTRRASDSAGGNLSLEPI